MKLFLKCFSYAVSLTAILSAMFLWRTPVLADDDTNQGELLVIPTKERIISMSRLMGVPTQTALCIARRESEFDPKAKNKGSSAGGVFQFVDETWLETAGRMGKDWTLDDKFSEEKNIEAAMWKMKREGYSAWVTSKKCL